MTLALQNALALPGLVNAHSHSYASLLRGTVAGAPLDLFVMEAMARRAPRSARQVKVAVLLHAGQAHQRERQAREAAEARAAQEELKR